MRYTGHGGFDTVYPASFETSVDELKALLDQAAGRTGDISHPLRDVSTTVHQIVHSTLVVINYSVRNSTTVRRLTPPGISRACTTVSHLVCGARAEIEPPRGAWSIIQ